MVRSPKHKQQNRSASEPLDRPIQGRSLATALGEFARPLAVALLAALVVLVTYWPVLRCQAICFDDEQFLFGNPYLMNPSWSGAGSILGEVCHSASIKGYYEPLTLISLMADVALGGRADNLAPFHRASLALHVANTFLIVLLMYQVFGSLWSAGLVGLLFGLHPMTVEPVAWVWERKTPLAMLLALACLIFYVRYTRRRRWTAYLASLVMFVLAVMSKPTAVPLPLTLLLLDYWPLKRLSLRAVIEKIPFLAVAFASGIVTIISTANNAEVKMIGGDSGPVSAVLRVGYLAAFYLGKVVWPARLSPYYELPALSLANPAVLAAITTLVIVAATAIVLFRRTPAPAMGLGFFFLLISPTLGIVGYSWVVASDKYAYLPAIGLLFPAAAGLAMLFPRDGVRNRRVLAPALAAILAIVAVQAFATRQQIHRWRDTETLFGHAVALAPKGAVVHNCLGIALGKQSRIEEATERFIEATRLNPGYVEAHCNLGNAYMLSGQHDKAKKSYEEALRHDPHHPAAHYNLGLLLARDGRSDDAIRRYREAIRARPHYTDAHYRLGVELMRQRDFANAAVHLHEAVTLNPGLGMAYGFLGTAQAAQGDLDGAIRTYRQGLRIFPSDPDLHCALGEAYASKGLTADARREWTQTLRLNPNHRQAARYLAGE